MSKSIVIGVDVGGTFTDIFALDESTGSVSVAKVPSTKGDQSIGFLSGIKAATSDFAAVSTIIHGTTVATNALLERKAQRQALSQQRDSVMSWKCVDVIARQPGAYGASSCQL